jgi:hypothetical protein
MLTIGWNPDGLHLIDAMPKREKHGAKHHINNIINPICRRLIPAGRSKLVIHPGSSRRHTANVVLDRESQKEVRFASHPPDFPDKAPSDFSFSFA